MSIVNRSTVVHIVLSIVNRSTVVHIIHIRSKFHCFNKPEFAYNRKLICSALYNIVNTKHNIAYYRYIIYQPHYYIDYYSKNRYKAKDKSYNSNSNRGRNGKQEEKQALVGMEACKSGIFTSQPRNEEQQTKVRKNRKRLIVGNISRADLVLTSWCVKNKILYLLYKPAAITAVRLLILIVALLTVWLLILIVALLTVWLLVLIILLIVHIIFLQ